MKTRRILMSLAGVLICAVSVGVFKVAALGVDPFQSLMSGLDNMIPIPFGTLYMLINAVLLVIDFFLDRHYIGISTFITQLAIVVVAILCNVQLAKYGALSKYGVDIPIAVIGIESKVFTVVINLVVGIA